MPLHADARETMDSKTGGLFLLRSVCCMYSFSCWVHGFCSAFGVFVSNLAFYLVDCIAVAYLLLLLHYHQSNMLRNNNVATTTTTTTTSLLDLSSCSWRLELRREIRACQVIQKCICRRFHNAVLMCKKAAVQTILLVQEANWMEVPCGIHKYTSTKDVMPKCLVNTVQWVVFIFLERRSQRHQAKLLLKRCAAAVRLQRFWRGSCVREKVQKDLADIVITQSCVRQWLATKEQTRRLSAAHSSIRQPRKYSRSWIQRAMKQKHIRQGQIQRGRHVEQAGGARRCRQREQMAARIALHRHWQGQMVISRRQQNYASTLIQSLWRGYHCRCHYRHHRHHHQVHRPALQEIRSNQHNQYHHDDNKYDDHDDTVTVKKVLFPEFSLENKENSCSFKPLRLRRHPNSAFDSLHACRPCTHYDATVLHDNKRSSICIGNSSNHSCPRPPPNTPSSPSLF